MNLTSMVSAEESQITYFALGSPSRDLGIQGGTEAIVARVEAAKKAGNKNYTQIKITGNHFFDGHEDELVKTVADWLDKL